MLLSAPFLSMCGDCARLLKDSFDFKKRWDASRDALRVILVSKGKSHQLGAASRGKRSKAAAQCPTCGKVLATAAYLKIHSRIHSNERPHECPQCGMKFTQRGNLTLHLRTHSRQRPYQCEVCSKQFSTSSNLKAHQRSHSDERSFECKECEARFKSEVELKSHAATHTNVRRFACAQCERAFYKVAYLNVHVRTAHDGEKRHRCSDCGKAFSNSSNLIVHRRSHTKEKPFECSVCRLRFSQSSALNRHSRQHERAPAESDRERNTMHSAPENGHFPIPSPADSIESNMALNVDDDDESDPDNQCLAASLLATAIANEGCEENVDIDDGNDSFHGFAGQTAYSSNTPSEFYYYRNNPVHSFGTGM